ncbi:Uncharacterised protein [uncultured Clostridium sp.]|nr:Uncharacterised protein [uncultured Clostridium sp.]
MNRKIMTIDELYSSCLKENFVKFDSNDSGKELLVQMLGSFSKSDDDQDKLTEGMTPFVSKAFHDHVNLNKSQIKTKAFKDNVPSSHLRPILANIKKDEETGELDFGSHDFHIEKVTETDENGNIVEKDKVVYDERPIGVIDGSKTTIEYDKDAKVNRAVLHGFLYNEYCQDAIDILNRRGTVDCSVELAIRSMSFDTSSKTLVLDDFYVSGLTLLSANTKPGMAGSNFKIEDFSVDEGCAKFDKDEKIIELLENMNKLLANFSDDKNIQKGGTAGKMFEELLKKYNKTVKDITFEYENLSDEELEAKFAEMFENDNTGTGNGNEPSGEGNNGGNSGPEENPDGEGQTFEKMTRTYELSHDDIRYALYQLLSTYEDSDNDWYFINAVYDDHFTYENWNGDKIFGQKYEKDGDNVAFDGERYNLHRELLTDSEFAELQSMRSNYTALKEFKETAEKNELHNQREAILSDEKYSVLAENEAFSELKNNMDNYSLTDLEKEAKVIFADYVASVGEFSAKENKPSGIKMFGNPNSGKRKTGRYGDLFTK